MRMKKPTKTRDRYEKIYTGKVIFDKSTNMHHMYIWKIFKTPTFLEEDYALPKVVPGPKWHQYILTVKK